MKIAQLLACVVCYWSLLLAVAATEAISSIVVTWPYIGYCQGGAGFAFVPGQSVVATSLGFRGDQITNEPVELSFWDSTGLKLGSVVVNTNSSVFNGTHYEPISPLVLVAGREYYLQSCGTMSGYWTGEAITTLWHNGQFTVAPELNYIGMALATNAAGVFPSNILSGANIALAPNFQFSPSPLLVVKSLQIRGQQVHFELSVTSVTPPLLTLLESEQPAGPWLTNGAAVLVTNVLGSAYAFEAITSSRSHFYRVQSP